jgi:hypothetical protein
MGRFGRFTGQIGAPEDLRLAGFTLFGDCDQRDRYHLARWTVGPDGERVAGPGFRVSLSTKRSINRTPVAQCIERRPPEPDRLSVVATRVEP